VIFSTVILVGEKKCENCGVAIGGSFDQYSAIVSFFTLDMSITTAKKYITPLG
jgi:hypothetical protein